MSVATLVVDLTANTQQFQREMTSAAQRMQKAGRDMDRIGRTMTRRVTLPLVAMGAGILTVASNFQSSMNRVRGLTQATGEDFERLSRQAQDLGRTTQFTASQAADAMGFLAMAGFETNEILGAMPQTLSLAAAAQIDLARAADITSNILTGYQLQVDELGAANDALVAASTNANVTIEMLGDSFRTAGPIASSVGLEFNEVAAAIGVLGNAGIQGAEAGTALRIGLGRLLNPTQDVRDALADLGLTAEQLDPRVASLTDIIGMLEASGADAGDILRIFGQRGAAIAPLIGQGADAVRELQAVLEESGGAADFLANIQMEGLSGALKELRSALEGVAIAIADSGLIGWTEDMVRSVSEFVRGLADLNPELLRWGTVIGAVVAAIGPLLVGLGGMIRLLPLAGTAVGAIASPAGVAVAALGSLVFTTHTVVTNWTELRIQAELAWAAVAAAVGDAVITIAGWLEQIPMFGGGFGDLRDQVERDLDALLSGTGQRVTALERDLAAAFQGSTGDAEDFANGVKEAGEAAGAAFEEALAGIEDGTAGIGALGDELVDAASDYASALSDALDLGIEQEGLLQDAARLQGELRDIARDETRELGKRNQAMREAVRLAQALADANRRAIQAQIDEQRTPGGGGLPFGPLELPEAATGKMVAQFEPVRKAAQDTARTFEDEWIAAISTVGANLGGLASRLANIATAFASGGIPAGIAASATVAIDVLTGDAADKQAEYNRALEDFMRIAQDVPQLQRDLESMVTQAAQVMIQGIEAELGRGIDFSGTLPRTMDELDEFMRNLETFARVAGVSAEELARTRAELERMMEETRQREIDAMRASEEIRALEIAGRDEEAAMMRLQEDNARRLAEAQALQDKELIALVKSNNEAAVAAQKAAQAEAELAEQRQRVINEMDLVAAEMDLWGSDLQGFIAAQELAREKQRQWTAEMLEAGKITQEQAERWNRVHDGRFDRALDEYQRSLREAAQAAREAAEAERQRLLDMRRRLQIEFLQLSGRDAQAQALQNQAEAERLMRDGADAATLALLKQVQALRAQEEAQRKTGQATERATKQVGRMASVLNAPTGIPLLLRRFQAATSGTGGGSTGTSTTSTTQRTSQDFGVQAASPTFTGPSSVDLTGTQDLEREMSRLAATIEDWRAQAPGGADASLAAAVVPEVPEFSWPDYPEFEWPALPALQAPELDPLQVDAPPPAAPSLAAMEVESPELPEWPEFTWPEFPDFRWPAYPEWTWPELPALGPEVARDGSSSSVTNRVENHIDNSRHEYTIQVLASPGDDGAELVRKIRTELEKQKRRGFQRDPLSGALDS